MAKYIVDYGTADGRAGAQYQGSAQDVAGIIEQVKPFLDAEPNFGVKAVHELTDRSDEIPADLVPKKVAARHRADEG